MVYQVIARKYRPQNFSEVVGQGHVVQTLQNAIKSGRIHHAYLFTGARGIGKTTIARILSKALNCEKGPAVEPCNNCVHCNEISNGNSMDVQEIDGASNTGVDDVRQIRDSLKYVPSGSRYKIYIIDEVHMLSNSAFNALLKSLEEPPPHAIFIFATTEAHKIPATILSRCQRFDLRRITSDAIVSALKKISSDEKISADEDGLTIIAHEASGSMRDAQSLLDQAVSFSAGDVSARNVREMLGTIDRTSIFEMLSAIAGSDRVKSMNIVEEVFKRGVDLTRFAADLLFYVRHMLVIKECGVGSNALDVPRDEITALGEMSEKMESDQLQRIFGILHEGVDRLGRTSFPKIYLEIMAMRCASIESVLPITELISRIDGLGKTPPLCKTNILPPQPLLTKEGSEKPATCNLSPVTISSSSWQAFMRFAAVERPQLSSILSHSINQDFKEKGVALEFDNRLYADMLSEPDRKSQFDELAKKHFGTTIGLELRVVDGQKKQSLGEARKQTVKKALSNEVVKQAAEIFGATLHEVKNKTGDR